MQAAIDMQDLKDLKKEETFFHRDRRMARDRPSPYGNPGVFCASTRGRFFTVARGPVPRDRCR